MTDPNSNSGSQREVDTPETIAYLRLRDLGIRGGEGEASYKWAIAYTAMINAVKVVREHGSRLPEPIRADLQIKFFRLFTQLESVQDLLRPNTKYELEKPLLDPQQEQKRYGKLTEYQNVSPAAANIDKDPPPDASHLTQVPTREDLYNMVKSLQKQILTLERKINTDSICPD